VGEQEKPCRQTEEEGFSVAPPAKIYRSGGDAACSAGFIGRGNRNFSISYVMFFN